MQETQHGAQAKVDRHAALSGAPGQHLPAGTDGYALFYNAATGKWEPGAVAGSGPAASKADPLGFGIPWSFDPAQTHADLTVGAANRGWWYRVRGGATITKIGIHVQTSSGNICVAVYANTGSGRAATPGARLATSGSVACPAAGYAEVALGASVDVANGNHWLYVGADNTTAQLKAATPAPSALLQGLSGYSDSGAFPAPSAGPSLTMGNRGFILIGVA